MQTNDTDSNNNGWVCTDPDCHQYQKQVGDKFYYMIETIGEIIGGGWRVVISPIDLSEYSKETIEKIVLMYYSSIEELRGTYAEHSDRIIAECIFESMQPDKHFSARFFDDEDSAESYIRAFVELDGWECEEFDLEMAKAAIESIFHYC